MDDKETTDAIKKRTKEGWIKSSMFIEALALNEIEAKESLEQHIEKMKKEDDALIYKIDFKGIQKVDKPLQGIETGYSSIVEIYLLTRNFEKIVQIAMVYGPTNIEILEPSKITMPTGEAQSVVNTVADIIHTVARMRFGGIPIKNKNI